MPKAKKREKKIWREIEKISDASLTTLAKELGVSQSALQALEVGYTKGCYAFPMHTAAKEITGYRLRPCKDPHGKHSLPGSKLGLFIPTGVSSANLQLICEGESDCAAALSLHFAAIGLPGAGHCLAEAVQFVAQKLTACPTIVADSDQAGQAGAEKLATTFLEAGEPCRLLTPPQPHRDLRDWLTTGNLTAKGLAEAIGKQEVKYPKGYPEGFLALPNALARRGLIAQIGLNALAVLVALGSFANHNGDCWPDRLTLTRLTGLSLRTIDRAKQRLRACGLLSWQRGGPGCSNDYTLDLGPRRQTPNSTAKPTAKPKAPKPDLTAILSKLEKVRHVKPGQWQALCPAHADKKASLSIKQGNNGQPVLHCYAGCSYAQVLEALKT